MKNISPKRHQGFTLVELIAVILIMGILSATALPRFMDFGSDARKASLKSIAQTMKSTAGVLELQIMKDGYDKRSSQGAAIDYPYNGKNIYIVGGNVHTYWTSTWEHLLDISVSELDIKGVRNVRCDITDADYCVVSSGTSYRNAADNNSLAMYIIPPGYTAEANDQGNCFIEYKLSNNDQNYSVNVVDENC